MMEEWMAQIHPFIPLNLAVLSPNPAKAALYLVSPLHLATTSSPRHRLFTWPVTQIPPPLRLGFVLLSQPLRTKSRCPARHNSSVIFSSGFLISPPSSVWSAKTTEKRILLFTNEDDPFRSIKGVTKLDMARNTFENDELIVEVTFEAIPRITNV
ncbi:hypothetical protein Droror1_Dr00008171 [Drosera rotundifolia]